MIQPVSSKKVDLVINRISKEDFYALSASGGISGDLSNQLWMTPGSADGDSFASLTGDNNFIGKNTFAAVSAANLLPKEGSLEDKTLIMSDATGSYNVNYSTVKNDISSNAIPSETWVFTLSDDSIVTKKVYAITQANV